jgi:transmembrane sensor
MSGDLLPSAADIEAVAAQWLERRDGEGWSDAQQSELEAWLAESRAHRAAYWRLKAAWTQAERLVALKPVPAERRLAETPRNRLRPLMFRAAAAFALVAMVGVAAKIYFAEPAPRLYTTAVGERKTLTLGDGSQIELNTDTRLRIASGNARKVWLDRGEAFFQIKHDDAHPFLVMAGAHRVVDLGTKFLIRQDSARTEVALMEGSARFESTAANNKSAILKPGDIAYATADAMSVTKAPERTLANALGWRHGVIIFDRTTLAEAASEMNRYNTKQIVILDPAAARLTIHGRFPSNDTNAIVNVAQDVFALRVQNRGNEILISR